METEGDRVLQAATALLAALVAAAVVGCSLIPTPTLVERVESWQPPATCLERAEAEPGSCFRCRFGSETDGWTWEAVGVVMARPDSTAESCPVPSGELVPADSVNLDGGGP